MTLEEAKEILKKEGFILILSSKVINQTGAIRWFEKPEVCEAIKVANANRWTIGLSPMEWDDRESRLKKEFEEDHSTAPVSVKEKEKKGNPALEEAASQFNDALLDEEGKKIKHLTKKISRLNKIIHKKNLKIEELKKESSEHLSGGGSVDLSQELCKKSEELRLSTIREKNLTELCQKYVKENEVLKKELSEKDEVIAEKDDVIADLSKELSATKKEINDISRGKENEKLNTSKILDLNAKCMRAARESINDVFESYAAKYAKSTLDELKDKAYESFNAKLHKLGLVGINDGKGIPDQMIRFDISEELSKVPDDVIDQILLFGEIIIKEEE